MKPFLVFAALFFSVLAYSQQKIVFLGDSLTYGYGISKEKAFPALIQLKLKKDKIPWEVVNSGISGSTTASAKSRMKWVLKSKPGIVFLAIGANDGLRGLKLEASRKNLSDSITLAKATKATVILAGMKIPPNYGMKYAKEFERLFVELSKKYDLPFVPFLLKGVAGRPKLNIADGIHPNEKGHELIANLIYPIIKKAINARSPSS